MDDTVDSWCHLGTKTRGWAARPDHGPCPRHSLNACVKDTRGSRGESPVGVTKKNASLVVSTHGKSTRSILYMQIPEPLLNGRAIHKPFISGVRGSMTAGTDSRLVLDS